MLIDYLQLLVSACYITLVVPSLCPPNEVMRDCKDCELRCGEGSWVSVFFFQKYFQKVHASWPLHQSDNSHFFQMPCFMNCVKGCSCDPQGFRRKNGKCVPQSECYVSGLSQDSRWLKQLAFVSKARYSKL